MLSMLTSAPAVRVDVVLSDGGSRRYRDGPGGARFAVVSTGDTISGDVKVVVAGGKRFDHQGVRIELRGVVEARGEKAPHDFLMLVTELAPAGACAGVSSLPFSFDRPVLAHDSYDGTIARVRYCLRAIATTKGSFGASAVLQELPFFVQNVGPPPSMGGAGADAVALAGGPNSSVKLEVGIEDCLHIEFEYNRTRYHLQEVVLGHIDFLLVRIKMKTMEIAIVRKETTGLPGSQAVSESETLTRYEIMDGAPVKGDRIPIKVPLAGLSSLTPSMNVANGLLQVRYFLNLVLIDDADRRYFKQQEVVLFRL